ncbi:MAG: lipid-A-disaccharide synthase [Elstera sp.]
MTDVPLIYLLAGEVSGDLLGGRLMAALSAQTQGRIAFAGVGGATMQAQGLTSLFPMEDLSLMGLAEILPHLPNLLRRLKQTEADLRARRPAALVTIDAPSFTLRISKNVADLGVPRFHYVAPQVWAWRAGRAKKLAAKTDHLLTLLPFEPPYFTRYGLPTDYVGHPVIETGAGQGDGPAFRARHGIDAAAPVLLVLPGSRRGEVGRLLGVFGETVRRLASQFPGLRLIVPTVTPVAETVRAAAADWPGQPVIIEGNAEKYDAFAAATAALAASGTVALELGLADVPSVIAYRMNALTWALVQQTIRIPFASLVNLILERELYPEKLQDRCTPDELTEALAALLEPNSIAAAEQRAGFDLLREKLGVGRETPSDRAARIILDRLKPIEPA